MWRHILIQHFSSMGSEQKSPSDTGELILQWGIWCKILLTTLLNYTRTKHIYILKKSSEHADAVIGQVLEQILNFLSVMSQIFSLQKSFAKVLTACFWWKLKLCSVVPSPNWTECLGFQSHLWYLWGFGSPIFLLCWPIFLDQVTQCAFSWGSIPQERWSDYETQALGKPKQAKPTVQAWGSVQRP